ncbi:hypothetical protein VKT23_019947 [Stygiomarasmius scandens]|uniref:Uncharacterized protein n=1 Tax=Marasmiellus scandens TaxID=2682957 RepID=A0ABR1ILL5_9AGAR
MPRCPCTLTSSPYELALPVDPFGHSGSRSGGNSEDVGVVSPQQTLGPMALKVEDVSPALNMMRAQEQEGFAVAHSNAQAYSTALGQTLPVFPSSPLPSTFHGL